MDENRELDRMASALSQRGGSANDSAQIAHAVFAACTDLTAALAPVIGQKGVAALLKRSVYVSAKTYPWLMGALQGAQAEIEFDLLEAVLSRQTSGNAAAGGASVLRAFRALLASLVGPALSERLLRTVWLQFVSASPTQDGSL